MGQKKIEEDGSNLSRIAREFFEQNQDDEREFGSCVVNLLEQKNKSRVSSKRASVSAKKPYTDGKKDQKTDLSHI